MGSLKPKEDSVVFNPSKEGAQNHWYISLV